MASNLVVSFSCDGKLYTAKAIGGHVSVIPIKDSAEGCLFEADLKLQSWPSFTLRGSIDIEVTAKIGAKAISVRRFKTSSLKVDRSERGHSLSCLVKNLDLREYFGRSYEYSA